MKDEKLEDYQRYVAQRLSYLSDIFAQIAIGDFTRNVEIPDTEDEFTELYVGIQLMQGVIREKLSEISSEKDQLAILIENLPVGAYVAEVPSGKPILANAAAAKILGKEIDPNVGIKKRAKYYGLYKKDGKLYKDDELPLALAIKEKRQIISRDVVVHRPDGTKVFLKNSIKPVFNKNDKMVSVIGVFDDITREAELELAKEEFVALASHQLRTPLGTIRWNLEMMKGGQKGELPEKAQKSVEDMYLSVKRLLIIINDMLNVSRIDQRRDIDSPRPTDVPQLLRTVIESMRPIFENENVSVDFSPEEDIPVIKIDEGKLTDIFQNLLSNAIKYNVENGKVTVSVSRDKENLIISFADTGIGMKASDIDKIFDKFYRTEAASRKESDGSGLGLFVVKSYLDGWGGSIDVESREWEGSKFVVKVPLEPKLSLEDNAGGRKKENSPDS